MKFSTGQWTLNVVMTQILLCLAPISSTVSRVCLRFSSDLHTMLNEYHNLCFRFYDSRIWTNKLFLWKESCLNSLELEAVMMTVKCIWTGCGICSQYVMRCEPSAVSGEHIVALHLPFLWVNPAQLKQPLCKSYVQGIMELKFKRNILNTEIEKSKL